MQIEEITSDNNFIEINEFISIAILYVNFFPFFLEQPYIYCKN